MLFYRSQSRLLNKPKEGLVCNGVEVVVEDSLQTGFIQSGEVLRLLESRKCNRRDKKWTR